MSEGLVHAFREGTARRTLFGYETYDNPGLDRLQNGISAVCGWIAAVAVLAITLLTLVEVVARGVFAQPLGWSVALIEQYLLTVTAFFGMVTAYRSGAHIAVVSMFNKLAPTARKCLLVIGYVIVLVGMASIGVAGLTATIFSYSHGEGPVPGSAELLIPSWLWRSIVPVSMTLGIVIVLIDLYREVRAPMTVAATDYDPGDEIAAALDEAAAVTSDLKDGPR